MFQTCAYCIKPKNHKLLVSFFKMFHCSAYWHYLPKVGNKRMNLHKFYDKLLFWFAPIQSERSVGEGGSSPVPLLPPRVERAEGFYSFRTLQERCASSSCQPNPQLILHPTTVSLHLQSESSLSGAERWSRGQNPGRQTQNSNFQEVQAGGKILNNEIFL